jgi:hypothetical protein
MHEPLDILFGKYVRNAPRSVIAPEYGGRQFMPCIFCTQVSRESNYVAEPTGTLIDRWCPGSPLHGSAGANKTVALVVRKLCESP